ncbi:2-isopropylmalate synthase [Helicobacter mustelae]|uniref:2-isopropylmalate synthase n=1 Tax=Helicobacter mustelae (strain ATCC 43772 / CCUG 25715 / CIP 103759 / LMG 18044 / NCTC 12198 / R85-136P) TaxID=679897 RepID=D3UIF2_HELM1|nr:2-isopropylmalate synthase [Helicobacter mustelae]CBG40275.1 2-isopropylmalate synthase [Helicobacter mustelae 12198]SQH71775.1 2-isopropylmalate synthase [Helicobacter mustelae]
MRKIQFLDTTLRDGEQTPGVHFSTQDKVQIALQLERWGVDVIEAGFPRASKGDFEAVQAIAKHVKRACVAALARCNKQDIDEAYEALEAAKFKQIHIFIATSDVHLRHKLKMTRQQVLEKIKEFVGYARGLFDIVQFSPEDACRTEREFLLESVQMAIDSGASVINIPDTVGYITPQEYGEIFAFLRTNCKSQREILYSCHCHNDLGMAGANALAAVENGAGRVEGTVNGIGERAGNTALEEVAVALHIRREHYRATSNIVLALTKQTSDLVANLSGIPVPKNKAIVGGNAYAHQSGIHQDGVLKNPETYEIITPQLVGVANNSLPLGKLSGRHAFAQKLKALGYDEVLEEEMNSLFLRFKSLADKKKQVEDSDILALLSDNYKAQEDFAIKNIQLQYVSSGYQSAVVSLEYDGGVHVESSIGDGSVQAIYKAIDKLLLQSPELLSYEIKSLSSGEDSQAQVFVSIADKNGKRFNGSGVDFDVLYASAKAYVQAYNSWKKGSNEIKIQGV